MPCTVYPTGTSLTAIYIECHNTCSSRRLLYLLTCSTSLLLSVLAGWGGQYYAPDFVDIYPITKEFRNGNGKRVFPAFRWKDGKIIALAVDGNPDLNIEYLYVHLQKRPMQFTLGLENENSFLVIPSEFVKDHELSPEEIQSLMIPDLEYNQAMSINFKGMWTVKATLIRRIKNGIKKLIKSRVGNDPEKILRLKMRWNKLRGRKLNPFW